MIESKAWNWDAGANDFWKKVAPEFLPVGLEWRAAGFRRALDLGCGLGRNAIFLAQNGFDVCAFDLSEAGVAELERRAAELGLRIETAVGDMLDLPYGDGVFDCVVAFHSIYHTDLEGVRRVIAGIRRVLAAGGELFVTAFFGAITLVPSPKASKKSRLNYRSKCSWAPFSTILMAATAAGMFILRVLI